MVVKCKFNKGIDLKPWEYKSLRPGQYGRFGTSSESSFGGLRIGQEYLIMGMIGFQDHLGYLLDDRGFVTVNPCQLFEVVDNTISVTWKFRLVDLSEDIYPSIQYFWGYEEFCTDIHTYSKLLVDHDREAYDIYFSRKKEYMNQFRDESLPEAEIIEGNWVMCSTCDDVWEVSRKQGVVICPTNYHRNNNPLWDRS